MVNRLWGYEDHRALGHWFTWKNNQDSSPILGRLDRVLTNDQWILDFKSSIVDILSLGVSDHCGLLIHSHQVIGSFPKPFKLYNYWYKHQGFMDIVKGAW
ncbi:hypothetical protein LINPERPRIM_LOCUS30862 [Linum perenne]